MDLDIIDKDGQQYAAGTAGEQLIQSQTDIVEVIGLCFGYGVQRLLVYAENLPDRFFDLRSGEAGEILQKLRNYQIKLAAVLSPDDVGQGKFAAMVGEENRGNDFRVFADPNAAEDWLLQD
jgi:hypothetical protein